MWDLWDQMKTYYQINTNENKKIRDPKRRKNNNQKKKKTLTNFFGPVTNTKKVSGRKRLT